MILWCTKHISFHCEGAENAFFMPFSWLPIETMCFGGSSYCSLVLTLLSCQYITYYISGLKSVSEYIYHNPRSNAPLKKVHKKMTSKVGVNPYSQPDRFFCLTASLSTIINIKTSFFICLCQGQNLFNWLGPGRWNGFSGPAGHFAEKCNRYCCFRWLLVDQPQQLSAQGPV